MAEREIKGWITVNGKHLPIYDRESKQDVYNKAVAKSNEDKKEKDIKRNKEQVDKLKGKTTKEKVPTNGKPVTYKGYGVDYDIYGHGEYSVQYDGDDIMFKSFDEAKKFIDSL